MAKIIPISDRPSRKFRDEREFLGRFVRADEASLAAVFRAAVGAATRSLFGLGAVRTAAWPTASLSQRLLRAGFCDPLRHHPAAGCAYSREELSAPWFATVSAAGGGGLAVDPGGIFARDQHAAGGAGSGHPDRRSGERADGLETDPRSGRGGSPVSPGPYLFLDGVSL